MALEIAGKIHGISETQQITDKFKKREFILELNDNGYTQYVKFQLNQDKCNIIDSFTAGEQVKVSFNLTGRQYTKKTGETDYITNIVAWKIEKMNGADSYNDTDTRVFELRNSEGDDDVLPF